MVEERAGVPPKDRAKRGSPGTSERQGYMPATSCLPSESLRRRWVCRARPCAPPSRS